MSKYYGEAEKTLGAIFEHVQDPCMIFFDEIDAIGQKREDLSEPAKRVLTELLQNIDGLNSRKDIIVLAATNKREILDPALTRSGRFNTHILVDKPNEEARKQIWNIHIAKIKNRAKISLLEEKIDVDELAKRSVGLVGADIEGILCKALEKNVLESFRSKKDTPVTTEQLIEQMSLHCKQRDQEYKGKKIGFYP